jgi:hypothetical protein
MGERRGVYRALVGNLRERVHLGVPGVDGKNVKMDIQDVGCGYMDWFLLTQDRDR